MTTDQRRTILVSYGWIVIDPFAPVEHTGNVVPRPSVVWLHNSAGQRSCNGKGKNAEKAIENLYEVTKHMLLKYVDYLDNP